MSTLPRRAVCAVAMSLCACAMAVAGGPTPGTAPARSAAEVPVRIDLNRASLAELKTLAYVGDAEARRIVAARPFLTSADIVDKAGIPTGVYLANKRRMVAMPPANWRKAAARRTAPGQPPA